MIAATQTDGQDPLASSKKYQIFLSSTFVDLKAERQDAIGVILDLGHIPAGMEMFPAADVSQLEHIKRIIDQCDYYVLIMAARYGSTDEAGISFTEREYDYAFEQGKVVLAFPHAAPGELTKGADVDKVAAEKFEKFRQKVMQGRLVKPWSAREDLNSKVIIALHHAITDFPQAGWIRGNAAASEETLARMLKIQEENDELQRSIKALQAAQQPVLEGLADLADRFILRYRHYDRNWRTFEVYTTWGDLFKTVGPAFLKPSVPSVGDKAIERYLKEIHQMPYDAEVLTADENTVRLHLVALGLLKTVNAEAKSGGIQEFLSLTERGKARLLELTAVRK